MREPKTFRSTPHGPSWPRALLLIGALVAGAPTVTEAGMKIDPGQVQWRQLDYRASKLGLSTTFQIDRLRLSAGEARQELVDLGDSRRALQPTSATERVELSTSFLGRDSRSTLLFSAADGTTYQREVVETGTRDRFKVVRYAPGEIVVRRREAASETEEELHPARWSDMDEEIVRCPPGTDRVLEPGVLLYLASAFDLRDGSKRTMTFFSHGEIHETVVEAHGLHQMKVDYDVVGPRGAKKIEGPRALRRVTLTPRSLPGREGKFDLLGLEGDIELFVDPKYDTAVLIRGRVKIAGVVEIWLQRILLS